MVIPFYFKIKYYNFYDNNITNFEIIVGKVMKYSNKSGVKFRYYKKKTKENKWKRRETQKSTSPIIMVEKNIQGLDKVKIRC